MRRRVHLGGIYIGMPRHSISKFHESAARKPTCAWFHLLNGIEVDCRRVGKQAGSVQDELTSRDVTDCKDDIRKDTGPTPTAILLH